MARATYKCKLTERLGLSDGNAAAHHLKRLKKRAVLTRYTIQIDWRNVGFPADFVILAESDEKAALFALESTSSFFRTITKSTLGTCR
ncbi:MAG TPA: Lrp/AsnC family transcriptional regulator [Candidatus Bathyarchaeia archaeon]|nr:Lrp/AsnC family transcriptional regulator [Candidatus Bathyarchaeia archaeon]